MPIIWNEPLSILQRFSENVLYSYLLDRADECSDPLMRMQVGENRAFAQRRRTCPLPIVRGRLCRVVDCQ